MIVILAGYMVRYPMGGMISHVLQYLSGLHELGHTVYFVEKSGYPDSCFDPSRNVMSDDCTFGVRAVSSAMKRIGMENRLCYVDAAGTYHGVNRTEIDSAFRSANLFIEMGSHEAWLTEAAYAEKRILIDGDPGFTQIWMQQRVEEGKSNPKYDAYFTVGSGVAAGTSSSPTAGVKWNHTFHPASSKFFGHLRDHHQTGAYTTVMNWVSYGTVEYNGRTYGHKDREFERFIELPLHSTSPLEVAIAGNNVPFAQLAEYGWSTRNAHDVTMSVDAFLQYIQQSRGEFTVCKNGFVAMQTGWFGDRSAAYLASGRPVIAQDTGFGSSLPCGSGLFAVKSIEEAASAIEAIESNYEFHSNCAREIAHEHFDSPKVMQRILDIIQY